MPQCFYWNFSSQRGHQLRSARARGSVAVSPMNCSIRRNREAPIRSRHDVSMRPISLSSTRQIYSAFNDQGDVGSRCTLPTSSLWALVSMLLVGDSSGSNDLSLALFLSPFVGWSTLVLRLNNICCVTATDDALLVYALQWFAIACLAVLKNGHEDTTRSSNWK